MCVCVCHTATGSCRNLLTANNIYIFIVFIVFCWQMSSRTVKKQQSRCGKVLAGPTAGKLCSTGRLSRSNFNSSWAQPPVGVPHLLRGPLAASWPPSTSQILSSCSKIILCAVSTRRPTILTSGNLVSFFSSTTSPSAARRRRSTSRTRHSR